MSEDVTPAYPRNSPLLCNSIYYPFNIEQSSVRSRKPFRGKVSVIKRNVRHDSSDEKPRSQPPGPKASSSTCGISLRTPPGARSAYISLNVPSVKTCTGISEPGPLTGERRDAFRWRENAKSIHENCSRRNNDDGGRVSPRVQTHA